MTHVYQPHAGGFAYFTSGVINGAIGVGGTWTAYSTLTLPAYTLGGTVTSNGQSFSGTIANLGTVTTVDLNGGTIDGTIIGGAVPAAGTFTTAAATTGNITTVNATTVDATNIEVTNLKAKDGTAAGSIADATGVVTLGSSVLTTTDINGGTIDGVALGGASAVSLGTPSSGTLTNCTGLPVSTGISGLAANVATFLATPSSANLASAVTDETGSGALVFATSPSFTTPTINTAASVGGSWTAAAAWTLPAFTLGGTVTSNGQSFSGTIANLGTVTTADINGGTIDGAVIGGASAAAGTFTTVYGSTSGAFGASSSLFNSAVLAANRSVASTGSSFDAANAFISLQNTNGTAGNGTYISNADSASHGNAYIGFVNVDHNYAGAIVFGTASTGAATYGERMRIDSSGNVGIGVTPSYKLDVYGANVISAIRASSGFGLQLINGATGSFAAVAFQINNTETARISSSADNIIFGTGRAATTRATLNSTGLGIGVTPSYKLHVNNNHNPTSTTGYGAVVTSGFYGGGFTLVDTAHCGIYTQDAGETLKIYVGKSAGETAQASVVMVLTGTGNVGIGVTPSYKLHVGSGQIAAPDGSAAAPTYSFASSGNADNGMYLSAANELSWAAAGTQALKLTAGATGGLTVTGTGSSVPMPAFSNTPISMYSGYTNASLVATKDAFGFVHLKGVVTKDTAATGGTYHVYGALASGYRPTQEIRKAVINQTDGPVFFSVATNGNFAIYHATTNNANVNLDVSFPTT